MARLETRLTRALRLGRYEAFRLVDRRRTGALRLVA